MELDTFIETTLTSIFKGVKASQAALGDDPKGGAIVDGNGIGCNYTEGASPYDRVTFDVALTEAEGSAAKGGLGVVLGPIAIGGRGESESKTGSLTRISFTIPIRLPDQKGTTPNQNTHPRLERTV